MVGSEATPSSVDKALEVMFAFSIAKPYLTAAEAAELTGVNRSTAHRMLQILEAHHVVQRRPGSPTRYELAARVLQLSEVILHQLDDLRSIALSHLTHLRDETGETAALHVRQNGSRVGIIQVESYHQLRRTYSDLGQEVPLYLGAPSLAMLAFLPEEQVERYLPPSDETWPETGIRTREELLERLAEIRRSGFTVSRAHRLAGIVSIAAPIRNRFGDVIASINVTGPEARFTEEAIRAMTDAVLHAASQLSRQVGYRPSADVPGAPGTPPVSIPR